MLNIICKKVCHLYLSLSSVYLRMPSVYLISYHISIFIHIYCKTRKRQKGELSTQVYMMSTHRGNSNITKDCHSAMVGPNTCSGGDFANLFNQMEINKQSLSNHVEKYIEADSLSSFSSSSILRPCFLKYLYLWT